jgi:hypothetical protein
MFSANQMFVPEPHGDRAPRAVNFTAAWKLLPSRALTPKNMFSSGLPSKWIVSTSVSSRCQKAPGAAPGFGGGEGSFHSGIAEALVTSPRNAT